MKIAKLCAIFLIPQFFVCGGCGKSGPASPKGIIIQEGLRIPLEIQQAAALETDMTAPGQSRMFDLYVIMKKMAAPENVLHMIQTSQNQVAVAYGLLYFAEKDEAACRQYQGFLKNGFEVQDYGVRRKMSKEEFLETLFNPNLRRKFTGEK